MITMNVSIMRCTLLSLFLILFFCDLQMSYVKSFIFIVLQISFIYATDIEENENLSPKEKEVLMNIQYSHTDPHGKDFDSIHKTLLLGKIFRSSFFQKN